MSTKNYKISCFSIIYEAEIFMQGLIDNILEQEDFENIEFIFINPKSPDKSKNILLPYLEKYITLYNRKNYLCWITDIGKILILFYRNSQIILGFRFYV